MYTSALLVCLCIPAVISVFKSYVKRCPAYGVERFLRARAICGSIPTYHCLYDGDWKLAELCQQYKQLPSGNYPKYSTFGDDVYYESCRSAHYQLGPVKSYQITNCLFVKSKCTSEGQIQCTEGNTVKDVTCRCDYKNGYAMLHVQPGCCSPTLFDDCTCIKKTCPYGKELGPDYSCVDQCQDGHERKDREQLCSEIVPSNHSDVSTNEQTSEFNSIPKMIFPQISYDTTISKVLLLVWSVLYFILIIVTYVLGSVLTTWRPFRFKLIPFVFLSTGTIACLVWSVVAMYRYDDTKMVVKVVMTVFTVLMFGLLGLFVHIFATQETSEDCKVYNEHYDKRMYRYLKAAAEGDLSEIKRLKNEDYIEMEDVDYDHRSALHLAACENKVEVVDYILSHHFCFPSATDRWNRNPLADIEFHKKNNNPEWNYEDVKQKILLYKPTEKEKKHFREKEAGKLIKAAEKGDIDKIKRLHKQETDMNLPDSSGQTALHVAAKNGIVGIVKYLLDDCKVSPFVRLRGLRPLDLVPPEDSAENSVIRRLLTENMKELRHVKEENVIDTTDDDLTIVRLLNSASRGDIRQMRVLRKSGCRMDAFDYDKRTALHIAVSDVQEDIVEFLLSECRQQDIAKTWKDRWNMTPFEASKMPDREAVHDMMLKHCPELVDTENDEYYTCLLLNAAKEGKVEHLKRLFQKEIDMNLRGHDGRTALHIAAAENMVDAVKFLVEEAKVDVSIPDIENRFPEDDTRNDEIKKIIAKGNPKQANELTYEEKTLTMVMKAAAKGLLSKLRDDVRYKHFKFDSCDYLRETPLHVSAAKGRISDVQYLVHELKVSPFVRNSLGKTPIDLVNEKIKLLEEKEASNQILPRKSQKKRFEMVKNELETAMENAKEEEVKEDPKFKVHEKQVQAFLFLNKAYRGDIRAIRSYLETDPKLCNAVDYDNRSALHIAVAEDHQHLVEFLKKNGADKNLKDRWGNKPEPDQQPQSPESCSTDYPTINTDKFIS